jgi:hypothetical protein
MSRDIRPLCGEITHPRRLLRLIARLIASGLNPQVPTHFGPFQLGSRLGQVQWRRRSGVLGARPVPW